MNILNSLKYILMHVILIKKKKKRKWKKKESIQFTTFRNTCNITKPLVLDWGKFIVIEYDYN